WRLVWWIGADDRWHVASREAAVRQTRIDAMPVLRTAMRVPGGDAVQHVFGARDVAVVDVTNDSPVPFVVALVVAGAAGVALHDTAVVVAGRPALRVAREPSRWAVGADGSTERVVASGRASSGPFPARADRGARLVAAFLFPLAHRTTLRAAIGLTPTGFADL